MSTKRLSITVSILMLCSCTSAPVRDEKPSPPVVPEYVKVPHPAGYDLADLMVIFDSPLAPKGVLGEFADTCDDSFKRLLTSSASKDEQKRGAIELVTENPEQMHWCFYSKISKLQDALKIDSTWNTKQKKVIENFEFLSPIANAFLETYHDSRYLRWATQYYSKVSEWVFNRKVSTTPENTYLLTEYSGSAIEPFVNAKPINSNQSVFAKYGIVSNASAIAQTAPVLDDKIHAPDVQSTVMDPESITADAEPKKPTIVREPASVP